jgi:hypothetical protein
MRRLLTPPFGAGVLRGGRLWATPAASSPYRLRAGFIDPRFTVSRAQVGSQSTSIGPDGVIRYHGADTARFNGAGERLLIEGQFTAQILSSNDFSGF